jgi:hypothetical protein
MIVFSCFTVYLPWVVDLVLLVRLAAVYPPSTLPLRSTIAIFAFPVAVKTVRAVVIGMFCAEFAHNIHINGVSSSLLVIIGTPYYSKIEWFLQFFDNA